MTDDFIERRSIDQMSNEELDAWVETLRERRNRVEEAKEKARQGSRKLPPDANKRINKLLLQLQVVLDKADSFIERAEKKITEIRALRLQLEDDPDL